MQYSKPKRIHLKSHAEYRENWVQNTIAHDPGIIGLGDLVLRERERVQPRAGRLDLLLQDPETKRRYEVELQLGPSDESHIIRTIEYWDIERKRYPQYDHVAVLIAEDITSRFLNVVSLLNGTIPLIAIQMQAFEVAEHFTLIFTKVLDEMTRGLIDEDEDADSAPTDRNYWETQRATTKTLETMDQVFDIVHKIDPDLKLKYNKFYVGIAKNNQPCNFIRFNPQKVAMVITFKINESDEFDLMMLESDLDFVRKDGEYRVRLLPSDLGEDAVMKCLKSLVSEAHSSWPWW